MRKHQQAIQALDLGTVKFDDMTEIIAIILHVSDKCANILLFLREFSQAFANVLCNKSERDRKENHQEFEKIFFKLLAVVMQIRVMMYLHDWFILLKIVERT